MRDTVPACLIPLYLIILTPVFVEACKFETHLPDLPLPLVTSGYFQLNEARNLTSYLISSQIFSSVIRFGVPGRIFSSGFPTEIIAV
jgi:hypothetical protein